MVPDNVKGNVKELLDVVAFQKYESPLQKHLYFKDSQHGAYHVCKPHAATLQFESLFSTALSLGSAKKRFSVEIFALRACIFTDFNHLSALQGCGAWL